MAILKHVWKMPLDRGSDDRYAAETISELSVIREDRNPEILFSIMENRGPVRRRITFALNPGQAVSLARFLVGITALHTPPEVDEAEADEGDITPTRPGREGEK